MATIKSIEEKARRYDEVFSAAKEWYNNPNSSSIGKSYLYAVLPELKESEDSEDERIRKEIIDIIDSYDVAHLKAAGLPSRISKYIAWLEKQGKDNMGISEATKQKLEDNLHKSLEKETPESWNKFLDEQGEQKHAAWSEEDEKIYNLLYEEYKNIAYYSRSREKVEDIPGEILGWLKSLKDRVQPQSKQEWSDEDSRILYNVKAYIGYAAGQRGVKDELFKEANEWLNSLPIGFICNKNYNEDMVTLLVGELKQIANDNNAPLQYQAEINWLKSLRPQNTWKPSDEHYELEEFAKIVRCNLTGISKAVQELFEAKYLQLTGNKMYGGYKD